jgi:hypothetical protein
LSNYFYNLRYTIRIIGRKITVYTNGIANTTTQPSGSVLSGLTDGTYTITIFSLDEAGNVGTAPVTFTIDTSTPTTTTTISITTTTTTTTAASGSFPGLLTLLACLITIVIFFQRRRMI